MRKRTGVAENEIANRCRLEYADADLDATGEALEETEKMLTYYELDLGLNHVTRRWSEPVSRTANLVVPVPGGDEGPSGVLARWPVSLSLSLSLEKTDSCVI